MKKLIKFIFWAMLLLSLISMIVITISLGVIENLTNNELVLSLILFFLSLYVIDFCSKEFKKK